MLSVTLSVLAAAALATAQGPIVDLGYAQYQGAVDPATNVASFLGLRYAAAPLGDLRFRAPQAPVNVSGVQSATTQPNECFQAASGRSPTNPLAARAIVQTEDCLFLSVYYPSDASGAPPENLPTLVWIHGGGYLGGAASSFNGADLIKQSNNGIVVVTIQYRLGVFGFLPGTAVKQDGALNAGLLDQDFALRWVNQNIAKFGGDPAAVTIWGESAGAGSVLQHIVSNGGNTEPQLFRGAITSSTFLPSQYRYNDRIPELLFSEVVSQTNCTSSTDDMACLRAVPAGTLQTANTNINTAGFFGTFVLVPVIDGEFITQPVTNALRSGQVNGQRVLAVTNAFEGQVFVNQSVNTTAAAYSLALFPDFTTEESNTVGRIYAGQGSNVAQANLVQGESIFICPSYFLLRAFANNSYKAEFAVPPALHGNDIVYYFPGTSTPPFNNTQFINAFAQSFSNFIISLDPNVKVSNTITPPWPLYSLGSVEMLFNRTAAGAPDVRVVPTDEALDLRCAFWNEASSNTAQ
ncbi:COesterase domain-containing protein [Mycena kentingensis (nom. inval.)]|nr:COesterase domain-containing protein [Mycena kentingensis (nom. inval.)]